MKRSQKYSQQQSFWKPKKKVFHAYQQQDLMQVPLKFYGKWHLSQQAQLYLQSLEKVKHQQVQDKTISQCQIVPVASTYNNKLFLQWISDTINQQMKVKV